MYRKFGALAAVAASALALGVVILVAVYADMARKRAV
jgi:hypothetical protein